MTSFRKPSRQLDFVVGYRLALAARKFDTDAKSATNAFLNNDELFGLKAEVRKLPKV